MSIQKEEVVYKGECHRWLIITIIVLGQTAGNIVFSTLMPIAIPLKDAFNLKSAILVNFTIIINMINQAPTTFLSIWLFQRFRTDMVLRGVITLMLVGSIIRACSYFTNNFWFVIVGSYMCGCCNAFWINVQTTIANKWFTD